MATAQISLNGVLGSNTNFIADTVVNYDNIVGGVPTTYLWELVDVPPGSVAVIVAPGAASGSFTVDKEGSYLLRLTIDIGLPTEDIDSVIAAVRLVRTGDRPPAGGETVETDPTHGWAPERNKSITDVSRKLTAGDLQVGWIPPTAPDIGTRVNDYRRGDWFMSMGQVDINPSGVDEDLVTVWEPLDYSKLKDSSGMIGALHSDVNGAITGIVRESVVNIQTRGLLVGVVDTLDFSNIAKFPTVPTPGAKLYPTTAVGECTNEVDYFGSSSVPSTGLSVRNNPLLGYAVTNGSPGSILVHPQVDKISSQQNIHHIDGSVVSRSLRLGKESLAGQNQDPINTEPANIEYEFSCAATPLLSIVNITPFGAGPFGTLDGIIANISTGSYSGILGILNSISGIRGKAVVKGFVTNCSAAFPPGAVAGEVLYLSQTVAGAMVRYTDLIPTDPIVPLGRIIHLTDRGGIFAFDSTGNIGLNTIAGGGGLGRNVLIVNEEEGAQYTSITDAITDINANIYGPPSSTNQYLIFLIEGEYSESFTLPDYTYVCGIGRPSIIGTITFIDNGRNYIENLIGLNNFDINISNRCTLSIKNCQFCSLNISGAPLSGSVSVSIEDSEIGGNIPPASIVGTSDSGGSITLNLKNVKMEGRVSLNLTDVRNISLFMDSCYVESSTNGVLSLLNTGIGTFTVRLRNTTVKQKSDGPLFYYVNLRVVDFNWLSGGLEGTEEAPTTQHIFDFSSSIVRIGSISGLDLYKCSWNATTDFDVLADTKHSVGDTASRPVFPVGTPPTGIQHFDIDDDQPYFHRGDNDWVTWANALGLGLRVFVVNPFGGADYTSLIQALTDAGTLIPLNENNQAVIFLMNGVYNEGVDDYAYIVPEFVHIVGLDRDNVKIKRRMNFGIGNSSIQNCSVFIEPSAPISGRAIAVTSDVAVAYSSFGIRNVRIHIDGSLTTGGDFCVLEFVPIVPGSNKGIVIENCLFEIESSHDGDINFTINSTDYEFEIVNSRFCISGSSDNVCCVYTGATSESKRIKNCKFECVGDSGSIVYCNGSGSAVINLEMYDVSMYGDFSVSGTAIRLNNSPLSRISWYSGSLSISGALVTNHIEIDALSINSAITVGSVDGFHTNKVNFNGSGSVIANFTDGGHDRGTDGFKPTDLGTGAIGFQYFNTTQNIPEWWDGTAWVNWDQSTLGARVLIVNENGGTSYASITAAIAAASALVPAPGPGTNQVMIFVMNGEYNESFVLPEYVHLCGLDRDNVRILGPILASINNTSIQNVFIDIVVPAGAFRVGITLNDPSSIVTFNTRIKNVKIKIDCTAADNGPNGCLWFLSPGGSTQGLSVEDCLFQTGFTHDNDYGIWGVAQINFSLSNTKVYVFGNGNNSFCLGFTGASAVTNIEWIVRNCHFEIPGGNGSSYSIVKALGAGFPFPRIELHDVNIIVGYLKAFGNGNVIYFENNPNGSLVWYTGSLYCSPALVVNHIETDALSTNSDFTIGSVKGFDVSKTVFNGSLSIVNTLRDGSHGRGTDADKPADLNTAADGAEGFEYFNTDMGIPEWWDGTGWVNWTQAALGSNVLIVNESGGTPYQTITSAIAEINLGTFGVPSETNRMTIFLINGYYDEDFELPNYTSLYGIGRPGITGTITFADNAKCIIYGVITPQLTGDGLRISITKRCQVWIYESVFASFTIAPTIYISPVVPTNGVYLEIQDSTIMHVFPGFYALDCNCDFVTGVAIFSKGVKFLGKIRLIETTNSPSSFTFDYGEITAQNTDFCTFSNPGAGFLLVRLYKVALRHDTNDPAIYYFTLNNVDFWMLSGEISEPVGATIKHIRDSGSSRVLLGRVAGLDFKRCLFALTTNLVVLDDARTFSGNTVSRPTFPVGSSASGVMYFNTDTLIPEWWDGTKWINWTDAPLGKRVLIVNANGGTPYVTISSAIAAAILLTPTLASPVGIFVMPGYYNGEPASLTVPENVHIIGKGKHDVIVANTGFVICTANTSIKSLTLYYVGDSSQIRITSTPTSPNLFPAVVEDVYCYLDESSEPSPSAATNLLVIPVANCLNQSILIKNCEFFVHGVAFEGANLYFAQYSGPGDVLPSILVEGCKLLIDEFEEDSFNLIYGSDDGNPNPSNGIVIKDCLLEINNSTATGGTFGNVSPQGASSNEVLTMIGCDLILDVTQSGGTGAFIRPWSNSSKTIYWTSGSVIEKKTLTSHIASRNVNNIYRLGCISGLELGRCIGGNDTYQAYVSTNFGYGTTAQRPTNLASGSAHMRWNTDLDLPEWRDSAQSKWVGPAEGRSILYVNPNGGGQFTTIQDALNYATALPRDTSNFVTIRLAPVRFSHSGAAFPLTMYNIPEYVVIEGAPGNATIIENAGFNLYDCNNVVRNIQFIGAPSSADSPRAIQIFNASASWGIYTRIEDCFFNLNMGSSSATNAYQIIIGAGAGRGWNSISINNCWFWLQNAHNQSGNISVNSDNALYIDNCTFVIYSGDGTDRANIIFSSPYTGAGLIGHIIRNCYLETLGNAGGDASCILFQSGCTNTHVQLMGCNLSPAASAPTTSYGIRMMGLSASNNRVYWLSGSILAANDLSVYQIYIRRNNASDSQYVYLCHIDGLRFEKFYLDTQIKDSVITQSGWDAGRRVVYVDVNGNGQFSTIQSALDYIQNIMSMGWMATFTIYIAPGYFDGGGVTINVPDGVSFIGLGGNSKESTPSVFLNNYLWNVPTANVLFKNLSISYPNTTSNKSTITINRISPWVSFYTTIEDCAISMNDSGATGTNNWAITVAPGNNSGHSIRIRNSYLEIYGTRGSGGVIKFSNNMNFLSEGSYFLVNGTHASYSGDTAALRFDSALGMSVRLERCGVQVGGNFLNQSGLYCFYASATSVGLAVYVWNTTFWAAAQNALVTTYSTIRLTGSFTQFFFFSGEVIDLWGTPDYHFRVLTAGGNNIYIENVSGFLWSKCNLGNEVYPRNQHTTDCRSLYYGASGEKVAFTLGNLGISDRIRWVSKTTGAQYTTIQSAIDSCSSPTNVNQYTIYVMPGDYNENINIPTGVNVIGVGTGHYAQRILSDNVPVVQMGAWACSLINFEIYTNHAGGAAGVYVYSENAGGVSHFDEHSEIRDCLIYQNSSGSGVVGIRCFLDGAGETLLLKVVNTIIYCYTGSAIALSYGIQVSSTEDAWISIKVDNCDIRANSAGTNGYGIAIDLPFTVVSWYRNFEIKDSIIFGNYASFYWNGRCYTILFDGVQFGSVDSGQQYGVCVGRVVAAHAITYQAYMSACRFVGSYAVNQIYWGISKGAGDLNLDAGTMVDISQCQFAGTSWGLNFKSSQICIKATDGAENGVALTNNHPTLITLGTAFGDYNLPPGFIGIYRDTSVANVAWLLFIGDDEEYYTIEAVRRPPL